MNITFDNGVFHVRSESASYVMALQNGYLTHLYWGGAVLDASALTRLIYRVDRAFSPAIAFTDRTFSLDNQPMEYPAYGTGDFRSPAAEALLADGSRAMELKYVSHDIIRAKRPIPGLPAIYSDEAMTLVIKLRDEFSGLAFELSYSVVAGSNAIMISSKAINEGEREITLERALSFSFDMNAGEWDFVQLSGAWARERHMYKTPLRPGIQSVESRRGSSSHMHNPFIALSAPGADENSGEVYGMSLVYSGNFVMQAEVDQFGAIRAQGGINPFEFAWKLAPGESFCAPEAVCVYSKDGFGGMSRDFHRLFRNNLCRGKYKTAPRPILINSWEAAYFNFNADTHVELASEAAKLGIELFVMDDGWFGHRNNDLSSLGDWTVNENKLPGGLGELARRVNALGMKFGLWVEPEMISEDSDVYRAHPDWCIHVPGRRRSYGRCQLVMDMTRSDVREYIISSLTKAFESADIAYVKWDFNRNLTEMGSPALPGDKQGEVAHRYVLGVYEVMEAITSRFPEILFESCSGGGGRFDAGLLYYMPQAWASDDTDARERLAIQYGTSMVYPISSIGAHVSASPNHQLGRETPLATRADVAFFGAFGYELNLKKLSQAEKDEIAAQVALYKRIRPTVQFGDFYRLKSPFEGNECAWMAVSEDRREAFAMHAYVLNSPQTPFLRLKLAGLKPESVYDVNGETYPGDVLMNVGLPLKCPKSDFFAQSFVISEL